MPNNTREIVSQTQEAATAASLYGAKEDQTHLYQAIKAIAPWVNPSRGPKMSEREVTLVVRRAMAMGLDPLTPHEVQIWKDHRGNVNFQLAYTLLAEWVRKFKGDHTEPIYDRLGEAELIGEGLDVDDIAYRVTFIMKDDIKHLKTLIEAGYEPKHARRMVEVKGIGVADGNEYAGEYFAPKGRSRSWKVKKRALTDAYRRKFGTPTRPEIVELRRLRGDADLTLEDWEVAADCANGKDRLAVARNAAESRNREPMTLEEARQLLSGEPREEESQEPEEEEESQSDNGQNGQKSKADEAASQGVLIS